MHGESVLKVALKIFMSLHKFDYGSALVESLHGFWSFAWCLGKGLVFAWWLQFVHVVFVLPFSLKLSWLVTCEFA